MRRLLPLVAFMVVGCAGAPGSAPSAGSTSAASGGPAGTAAGDASSAASIAPASGGPSTAPAASSAAALPAACAPAFSAYLVAIEPLASKLDPAKATLGDLRTVDDSVHEKSVELLMANNARAPYSCPDVGLEYGSFTATSPWEAVLATAATAAPGTVPYLTAIRSKAGLDVAKVADYGVSGCDQAVAKIKKDVAASSGGGKGVEAMGLDDGFELLGLYRAYMHDVQQGVCPRDQLGNDEFNFFGAMG